MRGPGRTASRLLTSRRLAQQGDQTPDDGVDGQGGPKFVEHLSTASLRDHVGVLEIQQINISKTFAILREATARMFDDGVQT